MRLPPLNAVRTFEAAGRLRNFSKAAMELNVTPGAVSRQIKKLEDHLGLSLFIRGSVELGLTDAGRSYLETVQDALSRLDIGTRHLGTRSETEPLHIWGSRFFIRLWLIPRLPDFYARFPGQDVLIAAAMPDDPMPTEFDVAIRMGDGAWPGLTTELLIRLSLTPVCSPAYLASGPSLRCPADLQNHMLLQTPLGEDDWQQWYGGIDAAPIAMPHRIMFTSTDMAYSAALDGLGLVLGRRGFFENDIRKGSLVAPFQHYHEARDGFYLLFHKRQPLPRRIVSFRKWLSGQLAADA